MRTRVLHIQRDCSFLKSATPGASVGDKSYILSIFHHLRIDSHFKLCASVVHIMFVILRNENKAVTRKCANYVCIKSNHRLRPFVTLTLQS